MKGLVAAAVMQIPECRRRYVERVSELMTNECRWKAHQSCQSLAALLRRVQAEPASWGNAFRRIFRSEPINDLFQRIELRRKSLDEQLLGLKTMPALDPTNGVHLTGWQKPHDRGALDFQETRPAPLRSRQCPGTRRNSSARAAAQNSRAVT